MTTSTRSLALLSILVAGTAAAQDDPAAIAQAARCGMCHQLEQAMLGPSYSAIAERYRGEEGAAGLLVQRVREGSRGVWGEAMMPPVPAEQIGEDDLATVVAWILSR